MGADGRKRPQPQLGAAPGPSAAAIFGKGSARRAGGAGRRKRLSGGSMQTCGVICRFGEKVTLIYVKRAQAAVLPGVFSSITRATPQGGAMGDRFHL